MLPTLPFAAADGPFTMLPNPCCFSVDGLEVDATSTDMLMHISQQDIKLPGGGFSHRLARLVGYLIDQRSFCPLYPAGESVGLDFQHWQSHCQLPVLPHLPVTPYDIKSLVKEVSGCPVANSSCLSRGQDLTMSEDKQRWYEKTGFMGERELATVYKAPNQQTVQIVEVKKIQMDSRAVTEDGINHTALRGIKVPQELQHDNVIGQLD